MSIVTEAYRLASLYHRDQTRRGVLKEVPYISHPIDVVKMMIGASLSPEREPDLFAAAYLHDVLEDTDCLSSSIEISCNKAVADLVLELTHCGDHPETKAEYKASFARKSVESLVIKIFDQICNHNDFLYEDYSKAALYLIEATPIFRTFCDRKAEIIDRFGTGFYFTVRKTRFPLIVEDELRRQG